LQLFFQNEIKKNDPKEVVNLITRLLSGVKNEKLKKYFIEWISKNVSKS
jgi:hypothetical protein